MGDLAGAATSLATESTGAVLIPSQMSEIAGHGHALRESRKVGLGTTVEYTELSFSVLYCRTQANLPTLMHFAEPAIWPSSIRTEDPTCANHVDVLTV